MAKATLKDGRVIKFPDGLPPDRVKMIIQKASRAGAPSAAPDLTQSMQPKSVGGFLANIPSDAYNIGEGIVSGAYAGGKKLVTDPVGAFDDIYSFPKKVGEVAAGGIDNLVGMGIDAAGIDLGDRLSREGERHRVARRVGGALKNRYWDNLGDTLYNEPVHSAMDVSSLLYGGEGLLARGIGEAATATKAVGNAAGLLNPLSVVAKPIGAMRGSFAKRKALKEMRANAPTYEKNLADTNAAYTDLRSRGIAVPADEYAAINSKVSQIGQINSADAPRSHALATRMAAAQRGSEAELANAVKSAQSAQATAESNLRASRATGDANLFEAENAAQMAALNTRKATEAAEQGKAVFFDELDEFRKQAGAIANDTSPAISQTERAAASQIVKQINEVLNSTAGSPEIQAARELARRNILARDAKGMENKSKFYTSGDESGIRNQFSSYGKRQGDSLTAPEQSALLKVVRREGVHGLLNSAGSKLVQTMLLGGLGATGNIFSAVAGAGISTGSRALSAAMTNAKAKQFMQTVLAGKKAQAEALAKGKRLPIKTKGLLLGAEGSSLLSGHR